MSDDLEDLLNDLSADLRPAASSSTNKGKATPAQARGKAAAPVQSAVNDDLEALMADLGGGRGQSVAAAASADELELLMADLSAPAKPRHGPSSTPSASTSAPNAARKLNGSGAGAAVDDDLDGFEEVLDDDLLDGILTDLAPAAKPAPAPSIQAKTVNNSNSASKPAVPVAGKGASAIRAPEPASVDDGLDALLGDLGNIPPPKPIASDKKALSNSPAPRAAPKPNDLDLDSLMADLSGPSGHGGPAHASAEGGELESLMAELSAPAPRASSAKVQNKPVPKATDNELDALMSDLSSKSQPQPASKAPAKVAPTAAQSEALINDLTRGSVVPPHPLLNTMRVQKPSTSDIDRLMDDLNAVPAPQSNVELEVMMEALRGGASANTRATAGPSQADLNALMNALADGRMSGGQASSGMQPRPYQPPMMAPQMNPSANPNRRSQAPSNADLDALMTSLKVPGAAAPRSNVPGAELDALMADLNASKTTPAPGLAPPNRGGNGASKPPGSDLDAMLADLSAPGVASATGASNAPRLGSPAPRLPHGICSGCRKFIAGEMVQAMGRCYHSEHFVCTVCSKMIGTGQYFEQEGQPLCGTCYHKHFSPPCSRCGEPIAFQLLTALGKRWHPECFVCTSCSNAFPGGQFFERGGMPFCGSCSQNPRAMLAAAAPPVPSAANVPRCKGCSQPVVVSQSVQALEALWHPEHFVCATCKKPFVNGQFYELGGLPLCPADYQRSGRK